MARDRSKRDDLLRAAVPGDPGQAALFRPAVESAPVGVLMVDGHGHIVLLNRELERMLGYAREELFGQPVERLIPERFRARHSGFLGAFSAQPTTRVLGSGRDLFALRKDGTEIPVEIGLNPFGTDAGTYIIAFIADISGRKLADEALRASERRLRTLLETVNLIVLGLDGEGKVDYVNPYFVELAGFTRDEVVGRDWFEFLPEARRHSMRGVLREQLEHELHPHYESPIVTKAGEERLIAWHNTALRDEQGLPTGTLSIGEDITERKRSEELIRHLTLAVEQSPAGVVITDTSGTIRYVNRKFAELTGFSAAEALGKNPRIFKSGNTTLETYREMWKRITAGAEWRGVLQNRRKDGTLWWNAATISPMRDADGKVTHFLAIQQDVTQQRLLEDQLRQSQKMEAVGRLAGGVAHDFNNLLTVISSYSELLLEDLPDADQARRDDLGLIKKAAADAAELTRQLLAFSRQQVLEAKVLDLNAIVSGAGKMLQRVIGEDITLALVLAPKLGLVKADPGQIEQVIMNLAVNARDAMPHGGKLTIETTNAELDAGYTAEHSTVAAGSYVMLVVSDTGVGMDEETKRRIFEPFFTTKEQGKGTGLGLATVYGIVKQSGGFTWVYSEPGKGAAFKVYCRRWRNREPGSTARRRRRHRPRGPRRCCWRRTRRPSARLLGRSSSATAIACSRHQAAGRRSTLPRSGVV